MIQDVDEALRTLVRREALPGTDVDVAFDAPTKDWSSRRNAPTLDLYLYDIREDLQRREVIWQEIRNTEGFVTSKQPPPRHYKLSYLVTAWTQRPEDEHRLLSAVLSCFVRHEKLPHDVLTGSLGDTSVFVTIALPPPQDRPLSDIWSALGGELKPSLDLVISAPLVVERIEVAGPPVMELPRFDFTGPRTVDDVLAERAQARPPLAGVGLQPGDDELELDEAAIEAEAATMAGAKATPQMRELARQRAWTKARELARAAAAERARADETVESGRSHQPGRTVRLRIKSDRR